jgi:hypothetical protein
MFTKQEEKKADHGSIAGSSDITNAATLLAKIRGGNTAQNVSILPDKTDKQGNQNHINMIRLPE